MANPFFRFRQFTVFHDRCAMKVTTDACLFGAWVARQLKGSSGTDRLLDIGAGTGLLSLMIAQQSAGTIDAVEIDSEAAVQAGENVSQSPFHDRIHVIASDILHYHPGSRYDYIVTNPPFYENELRSGNQQKNLAHHSEALLLARLMDCCRRLLKEEGKLFLLLPAKREGEFRVLAREKGFHISTWINVRQSVHHDTFRLMIEGYFGAAPATATAVETEIIIRDEKDEYTPEFISLLKDYYLYL